MLWWLKRGRRNVKRREGRKKWRVGLVLMTSTQCTFTHSHNQEWFTWGGEQTETIAIYKPQKKLVWYLQHHKLPIE